MSIDPKAVAKTLGDVGASVDAAAPFLPHDTARLVARVIGAGLRLASMIAQAGGDPIEHIDRIRDSYGQLKAANADINNALDAKFPRGT